MSAGMKHYQSLWQFVPVWDYKTTELMSAATGFTPFLLNFESMTSKTNVSGGNKNCVAWKVEKAVHYFVYADKVIADSSTH